jgi:hypothetical protein
MKQSIYLLLFFSFFTLNIQAQSGSSNANYANQKNGWLMYFGQHPIAEHWKLHTEYQFRRSEYFKFWQQSLLRIGVEYEISPTLSVTLGHAWIHTFPYGDQPIGQETGEQRIWQQMLIQNTFGRINIGHRYRLEQRWIENNYTNPDGTSIKDGYIYSNRFRYRFSVSIPINKPDISKGSAFISLYDEPFISFGNVIKNNHFDQNRFYAALGYQYSADGNIQIGYLNQLLIKSDGIRREINHTLQIGITQHLDLRRQERT